MLNIVSEESFDDEAEDFWSLARWGVLCARVGKCFDRGDGKLGASC